MKLLFYVLTILMFSIMSISSYARTFNRPSIFVAIDNIGYIQSLVDDIQVNMDGSLDVTETIFLQNPDNVQRNIFIRFFPYPYDLNELIIPKYLINQISVDNSNIIDNNAKVSAYNNNYAVIIYQKNIGLTTYTIRYHDYYGIKLKKDEDQLLWQLNNINLRMPFHYIEYNITFPKNVKLMHYHTLLGTSQENDKSFLVQHVERNNQENVRFYTTKSIQYPETFLILISIKKGVFSSLFTLDNILKSFTPEIYFSYIISILFLFYIRYYFLNLLKTQQLRYVSNSTIYSPPEDLTPPEIAYLTKATNKKLILTYITSLLIKGYFILDLNVKKYIYQEKSLDVLPAGEKMISNRLISFQDKELYDGPSYILLKELKKNINKYYVKTNIRRYCFILTLVVFALIDYSANNLFFPKYEAYGLIGGIFFLCMVNIFIGFFAIFYLFSDFLNIIGPLKKRDKILYRIGLLMIGVGLILFHIVILLSYYPFSYLLPLIILTYPNFFCIKYFRIFNSEGNAVYQRIKDFKEKLLNSRFELSSYEFEKYLPYAMGLNIENEWAEKFKSIYPGEYTPPWIIPATDSPIITLQELIKTYTDFTITDSPFQNLYRKIKSK
jgi:hypothetical protein